MARSVLLLAVAALALVLLALGAGAVAHDLPDAGHLWPVALCWIALALPLAGPALHRAARRPVWPGRSRVATLDEPRRRPAPPAPVAPAPARFTVVSLRALRC